MPKTSHPYSWMIVGLVVGCIISSAITLTYRGAVVNKFVPGEESITERERPGSGYQIHKVNGKEYTAMNVPDAVRQYLDEVKPDKVSVLEVKVSGKLYTVDIIPKPVIAYDTVVNRKE